NERLVGKTLVELDIRAKYGINIVAIKRGNDIVVSPQAIEEIQIDDILIVIGSDHDIHLFEKKLFH
ncbi:potassium transporter Trk, partial [Microvirga sp. 3-52]|nr:potassium transporter Trk [Microvirga sp. 3-52]